MFECRTTIETRMAISPEIRWPQTMRYTPNAPPSWTTLSSAVPVRRSRLSRTCRPSGTARRPHRPGPRRAPAARVSGSRQMFRALFWRHSRIRSARIRSRSWRSWPHSAWLVASADMRAYGVNSTPPLRSKPANATGWGARPLMMALARLDFAGLGSARVQPVGIDAEVDHPWASRFEQARPNLEQFACFRLTATLTRESERTAVSHTRPGAEPVTRSAWTRQAWARRSRSRRAPGRRGA